MSKRYRVVRQDLPRPLPDADESRLGQAQELRDRYGLHFFSLPEIVLRWEHYSETFAAGWLYDDADAIEHVFSVTLAEIKGDGDEI